VVESHDSSRGALIYQHVTSIADQLIADRLSALLNAHNRAKRTSEDDDEDHGAPSRSYR